MTLGDTTAVPERIAGEGGARLQLFGLKSSVLSSDWVSVSSETKEVIR